LIYRKLYDGGGEEDNFTQQAAVEIVVRESVSKDADVGRYSTLPLNVENCIVKSK
jgi:hypothetical protein